MPTNVRLLTGPSRAGPRTRSFRAGDAIVIELAGELPAPARSRGAPAARPDASFADSPRAFRDAVTRRAAQGTLATAVRELRTRA